MCACYTNAVAESKGLDAAAWFCGGLFLSRWRFDRSRSPRCEVQEIPPPPCRAPRRHRTGPPSTPSIRGLMAGIGAIRLAVTVVVAGAQPSRPQAPTGWHPAADPQGRGTQTGMNQEEILLGLDDCAVLPSALLFRAAKPRGCPASRAVRDGCHPTWCC